MDGYLSVRETARRLGRSQRTVRRLIDQGRLKAMQDPITDTIYIAVPAVDAFLGTLKAHKDPEPATGPAAATEAVLVPAKAPEKPAKRTSWTLLDEEGA